MDAPADAESWNLTRFDARAVNPKKGHVESTFLKLNDPRSRRALWVKVTVFAPTERTSGGPPHERGRTVAEAWAIAFDHAPEDAPSPSYRDPNVPALPRDSRAARHVAVKQTIPIEQAMLATTRPFRLEVAGVKYDGHRLSGEVEHGHARIRFDVTLDAQDRAPFVPFPHPAMYRGPFPKSKLVSPVFDARANGEVIVEGPQQTRSWEVRDWPAMQGHNWGAGHADLYAWSHCNVWNEPEGKDLVFEGFSGRVKVARVTTPLITMIAIRHRGVRYEAHAAGELLRARGRIERHRVWTFSGKQAAATIEGSFELDEEDTVGLYYPNPTGEMTYCLNSKIARGTLKFAPHGRAPMVLTTDSAALEIGTHDATHGIRMYV